MDDQGPVAHTTDKLFALLQEKLVGWTVQRPAVATVDDTVAAAADNKITIETVEICVQQSESSQDQQKTVLVSWTNQDEDLGAYVLGLLQNMG